MHDSQCLCLDECSKAPSFSTATTPPDTQIRISDADSGFEKSDTGLSTLAPRLSLKTAMKLLAR